MTNARSALPPVATKLRAYIERCGRIDSRTLAVFRIALGTLAAVDIFLRSRNFSYFYTDRGPVPQEVVDRYVTGFSIFEYTTSTTVIALLFVVGFLLAVSMIVGYKTRVATVLTFLFVISLDHHNPFVTSYADTLFRLLLFWAIFLPLGERWSIDAVHRESSPREYFLGVASVLVLLQMVTMYTVNGLHKSQNELWRSGEAAVLVFGLDDMTFFLASFLRNFPTLLQAGGFLWFVLMIGAPLLLLTNGRVRMVLATLYVGGHLSFALTVRIGAFSFVGMTGAFLFMQAVFWSDARKLTTRAGMYDLYPRMRRRFVRCAERVPQLQVDFDSWGQGWLTGDRVDRGRRLAYTTATSTVLIVIVLSLGVLLPHASSATNADHETTKHFDTILEESSVTGQFHSVSKEFGITQPEWSVFAPNPRTTDRYYVFAGKTTSNETYDVFNDRELTYERPYDELQNQYGTYRERFYMNSIRRGGTRGSVTDFYVEYYCENWEAPDGSNLTHLNLYVITEDYDRETIDDPENRERSSQLIRRHGCSDRDTTTIDPPSF